MKRILTLVFLMLFCATLFSQSIPEIKLDKGTISVKKLKVNVQIVGDIAITTYDMSFYNSSNRVLEGELNFPLGENQSVTRFALDINGNLREAVVVEKEKARVAFETTVRTKIDPALLEKTQGNNYKARIYPIPTRGYKRIVLAYQQKLILNKEEYYYKIPFSFKNKLEEYSLSINILNQNNKPIISKGLLNDFKFNAKRNSYFANINRSRYKVSKPILIKIPLNSNHQKLIESNNYFYFTTKLKIEKKKNKRAKEITVFWDNSLSQKDKKINSEIEFLNNYFKNNKDVKVNFIAFNIIKQQKITFDIINGDWGALKYRISNLSYDGATSLEFFNSHKDNSSTNFVFTNGLNTLSNLKLKFNKITHIINSLISANHNQLKYLANNSGGYYINLQQSSIKEAIQKLESKPLQIIGTNFSGEEIETYPKIGNIVTDNFSISGKSNTNKKNIKIYIGNVGDTVSVINFQLKKNNSRNGVIKSIWAQGKLNSLIVNSKEIEREIVRFSKKHNVISPLTSLLILDRVQDYVTHEIVPPKELQKEYFDLLAFKMNNKKQTLQRLRNNLEDEYKIFANWIYNRQEKKHSIKKPVNTSRPVVINNTNNDTINRANLGRNEIIIRGIVKDTSGTLPGVSVLRKGTRIGTETDFDGKFSLIVKRGDVLVFTYLGYRKVEFTSGANNSIDVVLEEDANVLDEVVVTRSRRRSRRKSDDKKEKEIDKNNLERINLKGWNPDTPYLKVLNSISNIKLAYKEYLKLREEYGKSPSFFIDVADYFKKKNELETAKLILTNVAEIGLSNSELLKALAYKFEEYKLWSYAVFIYQEILRLRPEDIQSYRDLALAYEQTGEYQKSLDLLYRIVKGEFLEKDMQRRFKGTEVISLQEFNRLIKKHGTKVEYAYMDKRYLIESEVDVRVVIDWNHNNTDIDLWIFEPNGEKCFYSNRKTKIGGYMSNDMMRGFGPEQYVLKNAIKGKYKIDVNYYGDTQQKISGPTFLKVTTYVNYGQKNEIKKTRLIRLSNKKKEIQIGELTY